MIKKLVFTTLCCFALSACNDLSDDDSAPKAELAVLQFSNLDAVSSLARLQDDNDKADTQNTLSTQHLIGFDSTGAQYDISNYGVNDFTPTKNGGFVVQVTEKHNAVYKYTQGLAPVEDPNEDALNKLIDAITGDKPILDVSQTMRNPAWYYVQPNGDYFLITDKKDSPSFLGENSKGSLIFSSGEVFATDTLKHGHFYNSLDLNEASIIDAISQITSDDPDVSIAQVLQQLIENKTIEKTKSVTAMSGDSLLSTSNTFGDVLIETSKGQKTAFDGNICTSDKLSLPQKALCKGAIAKINDGLLSNMIGIHNRIKNLSDVNQILPISDSDLTLFNIGLLKDGDTLNKNYSGGWDGESAQNGDDAFLLSTTLNNNLNGIICPDGKQCLYSISVNKLGNLDASPLSNSGFNTDTSDDEISNGEQNDLWVNDDYIVIKEAVQISIIDRNNNNAVTTILNNQEIDTINLSSDNQLYITSTTSSGQHKNYIYNIKTKKGLESPISLDELHAFKALVPVAED